MDEEVKKPQILLIEDDAFMIELLARELEAAGMEVALAKTGAEGVKKYDESKPDLILLDLLLPDQNGFETLRQIRRKPHGPEVKVLIVSNVAEEPDMEEAKRLGAIEYIVKSNSTLSEIVKKTEEALVR